MADPLTSTPGAPLFTRRLKTKGRPHGAKDSLEYARRAEWKTLIEMLIRGVDQRRCAKTLNVSAKTIRNWMRTPEFQLRYAKARGELFGDMAPEVHVKASQAIVNIEELVQKYAEEAVKKIYDTMKAKELPPAIQLKAAIDLADRSPRTSKTKKVQNAHVHAWISPEKLASMAATAKEIQLIGRPIGIDEVRIDPNFQMPDIPEEEENHQ